MRQSKAEIYLHFVWTTQYRQPTLTPEIERAVHRAIESQALTLGCKTLAINGTENHVHLLVKTPTRLSAARLMNQVKSLSSSLTHQHFPNHAEFGWQDGYGVFSVGRNQIKGVIAYIENQKEHHAKNELHPDWEETDEEYIPKASRSQTG